MSSCKYKFMGRRRWIEDAEDLEYNLQQDGYKTEMLTLINPSKHDGRTGLPLTEEFLVYGSKCKGG